VGPEVRVVPQTAPFRAGDVPMHAVNKHRARNGFVPSEKSAGQVVFMLERRSLYSVASRLCDDGKDSLQRHSICT
jgi:hypothetical protein